MIQVHGKAILSMKFKSIIKTHGNFINGIQIHNQSPWFKPMAIYLSKTQFILSISKAQFSLAILKTQFTLATSKAQFSLAILKTQFTLAISKAQFSLAISKA